MTEDEMERAEFIRDSLREDGIVLSKPEPYAKPFAKWYNDLIKDIDTGSVCRCRSRGQDDGQQTCWLHHDCRDGSCTHGDGGDDYVR